MKIAFYAVLIFILQHQANALNLYPLKEAFTKHCTGEDLTCDFSEEEIRKALDIKNEESIDLRFLESLNWEGYDFHDEDYDLIEESNSTDKDGVYPYSNDAQVRAYKASLRMPHDRAPIWPSFIQNFKKCAPGCIPANYGTYGKRGGRSCHPSGRAVDVGAIICSGQTHKALNGGKFLEFVQCMRGKMKTIYRNGKHITLGHRDHAHFSNGCQSKGRYTY